MAMVSSTVGSPTRTVSETARQRGVLFDIFSIFGQGGGADAAQFAASERGLQHVGRVDGAFRASGADEGMELIDEADDLAIGFGDFLPGRL